jgi:hypothetical protein
MLERTKPSGAFQSLSASPAFLRVLKEHVPQELCTYVRSIPRKGRVSYTCVQRSSNPSFA